MESVLKQCAELLDLDANKVVERGALLNGTSILTSLEELWGGRLQDLTLVLT